MIDVYISIYICIGMVTTVRVLALARVGADACAPDRTRTRARTQHVGRVCAAAVYVAMRMDVCVMCIERKAEQRRADSGCAKHAVP